MFPGIADRMQMELTSLSPSIMEICVILFRLLSVGFGADIAAIYVYHFRALRASLLPLNRADFWAHQWFHLF